MDSADSLDLPETSDEGSNGEMSEVGASNNESDLRIGTTQSLVLSSSMQPTEQQLLGDDDKEPELEVCQRAFKQLSEAEDGLWKTKLRFKHVQDAYADLQNKKRKLEEENKKLKLENAELKQVVKSKGDNLAAMVEAVKKEAKNLLDQVATIMKPVNKERPGSPKRKRASARSSVMSASDVEMESSESNPNEVQRRQWAPPPGVQEIFNLLEGIINKDHTKEPVIDQ